jgi:hypothetical protein
MVITILSEPRSGSTNLLFWLGQHNECTTLLEPTTNSEYKKYSDKEVVINNINNFDTWKYLTKHLVIKEICEPNKNYKNILQNSEKIIILFRENYVEQRESWLTSINTKKWGGKYFFDESLLLDKSDDYLIEIKEEIQKYKVEGSFIISYEELYYGDGIKKLIDYIGIEELNKIKFPYGEKYRKYKAFI